MLRLRTGPIPVRKAAISLKEMQLEVESPFLSSHIGLFAKVTPQDGNFRCPNSHFDTEKHPDPLALALNAYQRGPAQYEKISKLML